MTFHCNNLLLYIYIYEKENQEILYQFVAPKEVRDFIFEQLHSSKFSAHGNLDQGKRNPL